MIAQLLTSVVSKTELAADLGRWYATYGAKDPTLILVTDERVLYELDEDPNDETRALFAGVEVLHFEDLADVIRRGDAGEDPE